MEPKKKKEYIAQHFIPEAYLKNFSANRKQVFIYDKAAHRSFSNSVSSIANKKNFYDIPEKYIQQIFDKEVYKKYYEKEFFHQVEPRYAELLNDINKKSVEWLAVHHKRGILTDDQRFLFATMITIQYLRMPNIRYKYLDADKKFNHERLEIIKAYFKSEHPENKDFIDSIKINYDEDFDSVLHADIFADDVLITAITNILFNKHWVFYVSGDKEFYTSDNPILIKPHLEHQSPYYEGFGMRGGEVIFPLSSTVLLTLWDEQYFNSKEPENDLFQIIDAKSIRQYNSYQYMFATKQVYAESNKFDLIELIKVANYGQEVFQKFSRLLVNGKS